MRKFLGLILILLVASLGYLAGYSNAKSKIPSCLYLQRPRSSSVRPLGYDGKEGVDWFCTDIAGGGLYVDLSKWKRGW